MPAESKSQRRFMGMVKHCKDTGDCPGENIKKAADSMSSKEVDKFAKTKEKGLPEHKKKQVKEQMTFLEYLMLNE